jgi:excisionase family DNA binding protein
MSINTTESAWLSTPKTSGYMEIPVGTLYQWRMRGYGPPAHRVGKHLRYRKSDIDAWMAAQPTTKLPEPSRRVAAEKAKAVAKTRSK